MVLETGNIFKASKHLNDTTAYRFIGFDTETPPHKAGIVLENMKTGEKDMVDNGWFHDMCIEKAKEGMLVLKGNIRGSIFQLLPGPYVKVVIEAVRTENGWNTLPYSVETWDWKDIKIA